MELNDPVGHRQAYAGPAGLRGVVERKNFRPRLGRNAYTLVGDFELEVAGSRARRHFELAARGHRLAGVQHQVQKRLLDQVAVHAERRQRAVRFEDQADVVLPRLGLGQSEHLPDQGLNFRVARAEFDRPGKIEEGLDDAVEPADFRRESFKLRHYALALVGELRLEHFHLEDHGVQRVFDFVGDAGSQPSQGRELRADVNLVFELGASARVAKRDEAPDAFALLLDKLDVDGHAHRPRVVGQLDRLPGR